MKNSILLAILLVLISNALLAQKTTVEGYVYEDGNRGYLNQVSINIFEANSETFVVSAKTDKEGFFTFQVSPGKSYRLEASKSIFELRELPFEVSGSDKVFLKVPMLREEGYLFEVTLAPKRDSEDEVVDAIRGSLIEVYNNTTQKEVLVLKDHPNPDFKIHFKKGNHYTIMIRKEGFLVKRMEAFVNVEGCILCFEGVGEVRPGVADNLTEGMTMGTLLANVEMEPIYTGKVIELQHVYYEFGKSELTQQGKESLSKLAAIMKDNPHLNVELGSHTDVRGSGPDNRALSERRAKSAVDFLTGTQEVESRRIIARGYGESQLKNKCSAGVTCSEEEHAENRRTEIKILEVDDGGIPIQSLSSMKIEENFIKQVLGGGVEQVNNKVNESEPAPVKNEEASMSGSGMDKGKSGSKSESNKDEDEFLEKKEAKKVIEEKVVEEGKVEEFVEMEAPKNVKTYDNASKSAKTVITMGSQKKSDVEVGREILEKRKAESTKLQEESEVIEKVGIETEKYTGYRVVVHFSNFPISGDHEIYYDFKDVSAYNTPEKNILYLVGLFSDKATAEEFRKQTVEESYPSSYVVKFINGIKVNIEE